MDNVKNSRDFKTFYKDFLMFPICNQQISLFQFRVLALPSYIAQGHFYLQYLDQNLISTVCISITKA